VADRFVTVMAGGEPVPDSREYDDLGEAEQVRDRANRRAALAGWEPGYQVMPLDPASGLAVAPIRHCEP
jgi:hypothetical protein